jgi:hypothetical protein
MPLLRWHQRISSRASDIYFWISVGASRSIPTRRGRLQVDISVFKFIPGMCSTDKLALTTDYIKNDCFGAGSIQ